MLVNIVNLDTLIPDILRIPPLKNPWVWLTAYIKNRDIYDVKYGQVVQLKNIETCQTVFGSHF